MQPSTQNSVTNQSTIFEVKHEDRYIQSLRNAFTPCTLYYEHVNVIFQPINTLIEIIILFSLNISLYPEQKCSQDFFTCYGLLN
jgi:hypothetical protein